MYGGTEPTKESDETYDYTFNGWLPEISPANGNVDYVAQFTATEIPSGPVDDITLPYVTFRAEEAGSTIGLNKNFDVGSASYSTDKTNWQGLFKSTIITLANGIKKTIGWLFNERQLDKIYRAVTYNVDTNERENKTIINFYKRLCTKQLMVLLVKTDNKIISLTCTEDHQVYIKSENKYVNASDLNENDTLVLWYNNEIGQGSLFKKVFSPKKLKYVYDLEIEDNHNMFANGILVFN